MEKQLNLDIAGRVSELEILMKRVSPKNIVYKLVLGKGLEFDGYRDYTQQDDSDNIDWKASVRARKTLVRKYIEERDLKFFFFIDVSDNMVFGSTEKLKCEYSAELSAALAHLILSTGDRVGFILYNKDMLKLRVPSLGNKCFEILVHELSDPDNYGGESDLKRVLDGQVPHLEKSLSMVFLISDFINVNESYKKSLEALSGLFETVAIIVRDPLDKFLPDLNKEVILEDPKSGEKMLVNLRVAKNSYEANSAQQLLNLKKLFKDCNIDFLELNTNESSSQGIAEFLIERISRGRREKIQNVY